MKLLFHQLKTECYALRWALLVWAFIFTIISWLELTAWEANDHTMLHRFAIPPAVINWLVAISISLLTILAHSRDVFLDKRAQWITKPISPLTLYGAKALLVILTIVIPITLLVCVVYPPLSGWKFTAYFITEIWIWSITIIALISLINLQHPSLFTLFSLSPVVLGAIYINTSRYKLYNESLTWWFSYCIILIPAALGLLALAIFRRNKATSSWFSLLISVPLIAAHAYPLTINWHTNEALTNRKIEDSSMKITLDRSYPVTVGSISGGSFRDGRQKPDRISHSYKIPASHADEAIIPYYIQLDNELQLTVNGKTIEPDHIITDLSINYNHHYRSAGFCMWDNYTSLNSRQHKVNYTISLAVPDTQLEKNPREQPTILTDTQARITGSGTIQSFSFLEVSRTALKRQLETHQEGLFVSWIPNNNGGKLTVKKANTGLITGKLEKSMDKVQLLQCIIVNHKRKEWIQAYLKTNREHSIQIFLYPKYNINHIRYSGEIDIAKTKDNSNLGAEFDAWIKDCELIIYREIKTKKHNKKFDINIYLPAYIENYIKHKKINKK